MTFVVFDLDDTLYLERDFVLSGYRAVDRWAQEHHEIDGLDAACRAAFADGERRHVFDRALDTLGVSSDIALIAAMIGVYRNHVPDITLQSDAVRALHRHAGRCALISDGPAATQAAKVDALCLRAQLSPILLTGDLGPNAGKPSPVAYLEIERMTGLNGSELAYVADNPAKDFIAPRRLGWQTVMIARPHRVHKDPAPTPGHAAVHRVQTLDELGDCLASKETKLSASLRF